MIKDYKEFVEQVNKCLRFNGWIYCVELKGDCIVETRSKNSFSFYFLDSYFGDDIVKDTAYLVVDSVNSNSMACTNCLHCYNCVDCIGCSDCVNCVGCNYCEKCSDCVNCVSCIGGANLKGGVL